ncbi:PREDICTED: PI-PLC X domain-containing protein At5g67130-like [Tarenaya hassleriana]|uniref:PI-PLC X domain-containing protein At5g67130-like n=1 Tax=Tarenaya hassleriana TaxID=28532 RepID=UPI00053C566A|nr:PREDICTED: PI-PLC X domain-containing protein At5g67130-like [Tarenaya hassleriana]
MFKRFYNSLKLLLISYSLLLGPSSALKEGETCIANGNCDSGLHCDACLSNENYRPRCIRMQPIHPFSKAKGLPFNKYSWLTTHNSFSRLGAKSSTGSVILAPSNQQDSITSQLINGVRGFTLDMYDFQNDIWLCHSYGGNCFNYTAYQPAIPVLKEFQVFLEKNTHDIVTIIIEDYVKSPNGLTRVFNDAGLRKFIFPETRMPKNGEDWPTAEDMIRQNQRLVVFTSDPHKETTEGIAFQWKYMIENHYGNEGMKHGMCINRPESLPMNTKTRSLVLVNHFPDAPELLTACRHNSAPLMGAVKACYEASGQRWPNFISVDFYKRSDGGGASQAVDIANGHLVCGCDNIAACMENMTKGTCAKQEASEQSALVTIAKLTAQASNTKPAQLRLYVFVVTSIAFLNLI